MNEDKNPGQPPGPPSAQEASAEYKEWRESLEVKKGKPGRPRKGDIRSSRKMIQKEVLSGIFKPTDDWHDAYVEVRSNPLLDISDTAFAEFFNIDVSTVWRHAKENVQMIADRINSRKSQYLNLIAEKSLKAMFKRIDDGSDSMIKIGLEMAQWYTPTIKNQNEDLTPEQKRDKAQSLLGRLKKKGLIGNATPNEQNP